ncbi:MAG: immune inhibitor A [Actinobacteria bacterium]|nr:immune inhibitor A [Actinomycetota bacterium]
MRHLWRLTGASALALLVFAMPAAAVPDQGKKANNESKSTKHDFKSPMAKKQDALLQKGLQAKLRGKASGKVHEVAKGQFVQLEREGTDRVFAIIAEFGDARHTAYPDSGSDGSPQKYDGPLHNEIPAPDRAVDNTTLWQADYNTAHYENMYFNRMAKYYEHQSSNRYSVAGDVNGWVKVPFNEARYGRDVCGGIVCNNTWFLIRDAMAFWVQGQKDLGKTNAEIEAYLTTFDVQDRYDFDGDGKFAEKDGYIDHFQIVHAGGDQAAGDPIYGADAIWSHRWYANINPFGTGPTGGAPFGGTQIGQGGPSGGQTIPSNPLNVWVGDYTIQPENGGLGVFAHEYAHDLGLPDLYDTSGNTGGAENSTAFWSLMSSGANIGDGGPDGIGDAPTDLTAWELFQLGWLSAQGGKGPFYDVARAGSKSEHKLGPNDAATKKAQALFVLLPDKQTSLVLGAPAEGSYAFWSTMGDNLNTSMSRTVATGGALTAQVRYSIEEDWDYAFLETSSNGGSTWSPLATSLSDTAGDQSGFNASHTGITGSSGGAYVALTAAVPTGTNALRVRYQTDGAVAESGFLIDSITLGGAVIGNAESATEGWTFNGFVRTTGTETSSHFNAYVAENRQYDNYDASLKTAYNFGFLDTRPDWVEHFPYQDGLLINYWDNSFGDNNVGDHPGGGLILPVDAHPSFHHSYDGHLLRPRILSYDSTFGLEATDAITVHKNSQPTTIASQPAVPVFDDRKDYWFNADEHASTGNHVGRYEPGWSSVNVPKTGTQIRVKSVSAQGNFMQVEVSPAK